MQPCASTSPADWISAAAVRAGRRRALGSCTSSGVKGRALSGWRINGAAV